MLPERRLQGRVPKDRENLVGHLVDVPKVHLQHVGQDLRNAGLLGDQDGNFIRQRLQGKRVLAVVAGHMHLHTKCGNERPWCVKREGIVYVNAARVPRIFAGSDDVHRHHVALSISADGATVKEVLVPEYGG